MWKWLLKLILIGVLFVSCVTRTLKVSNSVQLRIQEFEDKVKIEEVLDPISQIPSQDHRIIGIADKKIVEAEKGSVLQKKGLKISSSKKKASRDQVTMMKKKSQETINNKPSPEASSPEKETSSRVKPLRLPLIEGQEGFDGRRPIVDPFKVGEKVIYKVTYMGVTAGQMSLEVLPMVQVNGRKHYHFRGRIWTTPMFSRIYSVDDSMSSMVDYETLTPTVYKLQVSESAQLKESRFYIDWDTLEAFFWEKKVTEKEGEQETKYSWKVEPYSQDVFSSLFYLRVFPWDTGVERAFPVADNKQNVVYRGKVIKKEKLKIEAGEFNTLVIEPRIELEGKFKPSGEIYIWLSDDEYKQILKIQAKVAIGSLIAEANKIIR
jgi:hypothetical protein